jgi:parallel beta-helix repeat protein
MQNVYGSRIRHFNASRIKPRAPEPLPSSPLLRKAAISSAVAAAVLSPSAEADVSIWKPNVEIGIAAGTERSVGGVSALLPVFQRADSLSYVDLRGTVTTKSTDEINVAAGHRVVSADKNWIIGGFAGIDRRKSGSGRHYNQVTVGAEALSDTWDFRGNLYIPVGTKKHVVGNVLSSATLVGNRFFANGVTEEAMGGFDVEMGRSLDIPGLNGETRAYLGAYHFDGKVAKDANGLGFRMEYFPQKNITLGVSVTHDNLFGSEAFVELRYSFGQDSKVGKRSLSERMTQFARRDIDVRETSALPVQDRVSTDSGDRQDVTSTVAPGGFLVIDNSAAPGGTGTTENPFDSFAACNTPTAGADCQDANTVVYVRNGNSGVTPYDTLTHVMPSGQKLIGSGVEFYGVPAGTAPTVGTSTGAGTDVIVANNNTEVAGLNINNSLGAFRHGVYAKNVSGVTIRDNTISNSSSHGIHLVVGNGNSMAATIANNLIQNSGGSGIRVYAYNGSGSGTTSQSVSISGNTIYNSANHGVQVRAYAGSVGGTVNQSVSLSNNTINSSGTHGVYLRNLAAYGGSTTQTATLSGNTINYSSSEGVRFNNLARKYGSTATQTATLSGNTINYNGGDGVRVGNTVTDSAHYSTATQSLTLTSNTISGNSYDGVRAVNYVGESNGGQATQALTLGSNTITGNDRGVVLNNEVYSYFSSSTATQMATLSGNTISNNSGHGVYARNRAYDVGTATQTLALSSNTIHNNAGVAGVGVLLRNAAEFWDDGGAVATQTATLSGNSIRYNSGFGVNARSYAEQEGTATQTLTLSNNTIRYNGNHGVYLRNRTTGSYATATQTATLTGNTISNNNGDGVKLDNNADGDNSTATQTATLSNNTISDNSWGGVFARNYSNNSNATATQTLTLTGNTISGNGGNGVSFKNEVYESSGTYVTQMATLTGNTISNNGGRGVYAYNHGYGGGTATQTLTLTNNTIGGNTGDGVRIRNVATYYDGISGTATQTATLTSNTISGNGGDGVFLNNRSGYDSTATQAVTLTGNTIRYNVGHGVSADNRAVDNYGTSTQTLALTSNTINGNYGDGVRLRNDTNENSNAVLTQTATLSNNTISGNSGRGLSARNYAYFNGDTATQNVTLTNNTISGADIGLYARNDADGGYAVASQTLNLSGNSITSTGNHAMRLKNRSGNATYISYAWYGAAATQIVNLNPPSATANALSGGPASYGAFIYNASNGMSTQAVTLTNSTLTGGNGNFYSNGNGNQTVIP